MDFNFNRFSVRARKKREERRARALAAQAEHDFFLLFKENTTIHGLRDLVVSPRCDLTFIWALLLCCSLLLTLHGCATVFEEFMASRVVVSYFIKESETLPLPDVVICPFNRYNRSHLLHLNVSDDLAQHLELAYPNKIAHRFQQEIIYKTYLKTNELDIELQALLQRLGNISFADFLSQASLSCEAFFQDHKRCRNVTEISTSLGRCFRLTLGTQSRDGLGYGTTVVITLPHHLYHHGGTQYPNDGVALKLVEHNTGIDNDIAFIPSGTHALVPLTATKYEFMNDPPRYFCDDNPAPGYSRLWCFEKCMLADAEDACGCSVAGMTNPNKNVTCTPKMFYTCFVVNLQHSDSERIQECRQNCKVTCEYWSYGKTLSYATFPAKHIRHRFTEIEWEAMQSTIVIDVFFTALEHTIIRHIRNMPLSAAVAQFGGQLSLWAGASAMSLAQIIIYLCYIFIHRCRLFLSIRRTHNEMSALHSDRPSRRLRPPPLPLDPSVIGGGFEKAHSLPLNSCLKKKPNNLSDEKVDDDQGSNHKENRTGSTCSSLHPAPYVRRATFADFSDCDGDSEL